MIATVNVRAYYQPHCAECMKQVEETVAQTIRDNSVMGVVLIAQKKCEHDALATPRLHHSAQPTAPKPQPPQPGAMALLPGVDVQVNGHDVIQ